ncbi:MAG: Slp family lipoprotein [Planctomycetia bacterium]|nr:Slp family lipoprotein [Planctomycetia bacterium]
MSHSFLSNADCLAISLASCAPVISKQVREQVKPDTTFMAVLNNPERFQGQMVLLSGVIVDAKNTKEGTLLQVLQRPAGFRGQPKAGQNRRKVFGTRQPVPGCVCICQRERSDGCRRGFGKEDFTFGHNRIHISTDPCEGAVSLACD